MTVFILVIYLLWLMAFGSDDFQPWQFHLLAITALGLLGANDKLSDIRDAVKKG